MAFRGNPRRACSPDSSTSSVEGWTAPGMPGFVYLTLLSNSAQVVIVPLLAGGLWWITADRRFIGQKYRNRWWENLVMLVLFGLAIWGAYGAIRSVYTAVFA